MQPTADPRICVRSPAPNGRYRAPAPSALTKLFAFYADRRPRPSRPCRSRVRGAAATPQLIIYYFRSNRWLPNGVNEAICSEPGAGLSPSGNGKPGRTWDHRPWRCSSPIPGVARPPSIIPHSILRTPLAGSIADLARIRSRTASIPLCVRIPARRAPRIRPADPRRLLFAPTNNRRLIRHLRNNRQLYDQTHTPTMDQDSPAPGAGGSGPKTPSTLEFIQQVLTKALSDIGYEAPQDVASSSSDEGATCSDSTVVGSDSESENSNTSFTLVEGKINDAKALKKRRWLATSRDGHRPIIGAHIPCKRCKALPAAVQQTQTTSTASVESTRNPVSASTQAVTAKTLWTGAKPTAPPRPKLPPPIFCAKALTSSNIRRLHPSADKL
ncbi:hypothetical protein EVAR_64209_1 [Eumeta japonica]|uniref:Uncharacterized protein n=1 Tax=Eumeta variegata TaxID=151549 RepID=A0A4C1Z1U0_EUMVA|nr:hypothetical protein EVAR_64209_1 [Eumeta japonica]